MPRALSDRRVRLIVALSLIVLLAVGLRVWGIDNGLPSVQLSEESSDISTAMRIASGGAPRYYYHRVAWPLTQIPAHALHFLVLKLTRPGFGIDDFRTLFLLNRGPFILTARLLAALVSVLAVVAAFFAGRLMTRSDGGGLLAAALYALQPSIVYVAHVAMPDGYALLWVMLALLFSLRIAQDGSRWAYAAAGAAAALVLLTRLQALTIVVPIGVAHLVVWWQAPDRSFRTFVLPIFIAGGGFLLASVVFNPFIVLRPAAAWNDIRSIFAGRYVGEVGSALPLGKSYRLNTQMAVVMMSPYLTVAAGIATLLIAWQRRLDAFLVSLFLVVFLVSLGPANRPDITHLLPAAVPAVLLAAYLLHALLASQRKPLMALGGLSAAVLLGLAGYQSLHLDRILAQPHTRVLAYDYVADQVPPGSRVLVGNTFSFSVPLTPSLTSLERMDGLIDLPESFQYLLDHPDAIQPPAYDLYSTEYRASLTGADDMRRLIAEQRIEYVIVADYCGGTGDAYAESGSADFPYLAPDLAADLVLLQTFSPFDGPDCERFIDMRLPLRDLDLWRWNRPGPVVRIFEVAAGFE